MCGIVGYVGREEAVPVLLQGLYKLEYRGYDSAGVAVLRPEGLKVVKTKGRIKNLEDKVQQVGGMEATCGIGHTRWATHGEPSDVNAHPHISRNGRIAIGKCSQKRAMRCSPRPTPKWWPTCLSTTSRGI